MPGYIEYWTEEDEQFWEAEYEEYLRQRAEQLAYMELLNEEMKEYPLFFWKITCRNKPTASNHQKGDSTE